MKCHGTILCYILYAFADTKDWSDHSFGINFDVNPEKRMINISQLGFKLNPFFVRLISFIVILIPFLWLFNNYMTFWLISLVKKRNIVYILHVTILTWYVVQFCLSINVNAYNNIGLSLITKKLTEQTSLAMNQQNLVKQIITMHNSIWETSFSFTRSFPLFLFLIKFNCLICFNFNSTTLVYFFFFN